MTDLDEQSHRRYQRRMRALLILVGLVFGAIFLLLIAHALLVGQGSLLLDLWNNGFMLLGSLAMYSGLAFALSMGLFALIMLPLLVVFIIKSRGKIK